MRTTGKRPGGVTGKGFLPGKSGNPGGRPKGLAELVRKQTAEGAELVTFALGVLRNTKRSLVLRLEAAKWLADRGWGRPVQAIEADTPTSITVIIEEGSSGVQPPKPVDGRRVGGPADRDSERPKQLSPGPQPDPLEPYRSGPPASW